MAKKTSVNLTTSDGKAFVLGASEILLVLAEGTGSKVTYVRDGSSRKTVSVAEAPADISTAHGGLINLTEADDSTSFWIQGDRISNVDEGPDTGSRATLSVVQTTDPVAQVSTLTFDADLITANQFDVDIDGTGLTSETFDTDHDTTMENIRAQIETDFTYLTATLTDAVNNRVITITANEAGRLFTLANEAVTLGASQAGVTDATPTANVKEVQTFTPANVEIGDEFYASCSGETVSFTATAATVANVTAGLKVVIDAAIAGAADWSTFDYDGTNATDNSTDLTVTGKDGFTFTAATANTTSYVEYMAEGMRPTRYKVTDNVDEIQVLLDAL